MKLLSSSCSVRRTGAIMQLRLQMCGKVCAACAEMYCKVEMFERLMESMVVQGAQKKGQITFR